MLRAALTHPLILQALASAGHGSRVLIADGNYPASTELNPRAVRVDLNLRPGLIDVPTVLDTLAPMVVIESAVMMQPPGDEWPEVQTQVRGLLTPGLPLTRRLREEFYALCRGHDTTLAIVTGETRRFGNVLFTIGVTTFPG